MSRRVLAAAGAAALLAVALPALPALAAGESGSAKLTAGADVFPGLGQTYTLSVSNTSLTGAVNALRLTFPPSGVGVTAAAAQTDPLPAGFVATPSANGSSIFFSRGSIPAGGTVELPFKANVATPAADRAGRFTVTLSQDGGATGFGAADAGLQTVVRVLEVLAAPAPTAPAGVTDGTATGGQAVTESFTVANRGSAALQVTPKLESSNSSDTITQPGPVSLAPGGSTPVSVPVTLGAAPANRTSTFTASASATGAAAPRRTSSLAVQAPAAINAGRLDPSALRPGISYGFTVGAAKTGTPTLTAVAGTLSFAPRADGTPATKANLSSPTSLANNDATTLTYASTVVRGDGTPPNADGTGGGDNKSYPVRLDFTLTDDNGHTYNTTSAPANGVTLDALAPVVTIAGSLPTDADGRRQTAAKNGDTVSYSGTLDNCADKIDFVRITPNVGSSFDAAKPTPSRDATGTCRFSGSFPSVAFDPTATAFTISAQASDAAQNTGGGATPTPFIVDNIRPALTYSQTVSTTRILVRFDEANKVYGGCNPTQYKVDGDPLVQRVLYSNDQACVPGQAGPDNDRILVLTQPKDQDFSTTVQYTPGTRPTADPAKDDASADAAAAAVKTVVGIAPAPPVLVKATRNGGKETAFTESGSSATGPTYYTRIAGDDLVIDFTGGRLGYSAQIVDSAGGVLRTVPAGSSPAMVRVPLGTLADGTYSFGLRLLNGTSIPSTTVPFRVVLDRVKPALQSVTAAPSLDGSVPVTVKFTEFLAAGTDFAFDWTVFQDEADTGRNFYAVTRVTATDSTTRTLTTQGNTKTGSPVGATYEIVTDGARAYEDKAGNPVISPSTR